MILLMTQLILPEVGDLTAQKGRMSVSPGPHSFKVMVCGINKHRLRS